MLMLKSLQNGTNFYIINCREQNAWISRTLAKSTNFPTKSSPEIKFMSLTPWLNLGGPGGGSGYQILRCP